MDEADLAAEITPRVRRAIGLMLAAVVVIAGTSLYYLRPWEAAQRVAVTSKIVESTTSPNFGFAYDFKSSALGWALEVKMSADTDDGTFWLWRTVDGARHWQLQIHGTTCCVGSTFQSFKFVDARDGFVAGGKPLVLYRTADGGVHWNSVPLPVQTSPFVQFVDAQHAWLSLGQDRGQPAQPSWTTADGGRTWATMPAMPYDATPFAVFRDWREGWAGATTNDRPRLYVTGDGGSTWRRVDLPTALAGTPEDVAWTWVELPPGHGVVAHIGFRESSETMISPDGGSTWRDVGAAPNALPLDTIAYQDADRWWGVVGVQLYKSDDAGSTWQPAAKFPTGMHLVKVLDARHAWAQNDDAAGNTLELTSDGGESWTELHAPLVVS